MRARTIFGILIVLILLFTFGPALVALGSEFVAEAFGCKTNLNYAVPCTIGGKDYGQSFYDLGFLIWYSYFTLPIGAAFLAVWALTALVAFIAARRRQGRPTTEPVSPGKSFLRNAAIAILLALSPIAITYSAGFIASRMGCDLNEVSEHPCALLGADVGSLLATLAQSIWFISLTVMAGLVALLVLFIVWLVRVVGARRAKVDGTAASA